MAANGKTFEKEWVPSPGPFDTTRQIDVFVVTDAADILPLAENLQLSGGWRVVPTHLRARKRRLLEREVRQVLAGEDE